MATSILVVAADESTIAELTTHITDSVNANLTIVDSLEEAGGLLESQRFSMILAAGELPDGDGLSLVRHDCAESPLPPLILLEEADPDAERILAALRMGVLDVLPHPYDYERLTGVLREVARQRRGRTRRRRQHRRLRRINSRMMQDRRVLRQRVDLICRDLVQAYRRLAEKVVGLQSTGIE